MTRRGGVGAKMRALGTVAGIVLLGVLLTKLVSGRSASVQEAWQAAAKELAGTIEDGPGLGTIVATVDDITVRLDADTSPANMGRVVVWAEATLMVVEAEVLRGGEFWIHVVARDLRGLAEGTLEGQVFETGDHAFDKAYKAKTNRPGVARAWLDKERRCSIEGLASIELGVGRAGVRVHVASVIRGKESVVQAARSVASLARGGEAWSARWKTATDRLGARSVGSTAMEILRGGKIVRISADDLLQNTVVSVDGAHGTRMHEELQGVDPDIDAWQAAIEQVVARTNGGASQPYR